MACKMSHTANEATSMIDFAIYVSDFSEKERKYVKYVARWWWDEHLQMGKISILYQMFSRLISSNMPNIQFTMATVCKCCWKLKKRQVKAMWNTARRYGSLLKYLSAPTASGKVEMLHFSSEKTASKVFETISIPVNLYYEGMKSSEWKKRQRRKLYGGKIQITRMMRI